MTARGSETSGRPAARWKVLLAVLSLLVIGGISGAALDRHLASSPHRPPHGSLPLSHDNVSDIHDAALASLKDRLDLDHAQRRQVDSIVDAHHETLRRTWATLHSDLMATVDTVHAELETVLTPAQRRELRAWLGERSGSRRH
jgi:hypothetical protein